MAVGLIAIASLHAEEAKFEVASIRPGNPEINRVGIQFMPGGGLQASNVTLKALITLAYDVQPQQVSGGPGWMDSERFVIQAKGPGGADRASREEERRLALLRLQALLAERFGLVIRRESKDISGYALVVAKGGPKLVESKATANGIRQMGRGEVSGQGVTMDMVARTVGRAVGRTVVDKTGLKGQYDVSLKWSPQPGEGGGFGPRGTAPAGDSADSSGPSLFTALQEQLGLRIESQKVAADLIVVERAEKPSEN
jgi:uncharacterized protein (TIGR03435 family)